MWKVKFWSESKMFIFFFSLFFNRPSKTIERIKFCGLDTEMNPKKDKKIVIGKTNLE